MKRILCLALLSLSCHAMAGQVVVDESEMQAYVADVIPGQTGQPNMLVPSVVWQGIRVEKDAKGICTQTAQHLTGYKDSMKMGITLHVPTLETQETVVPCPA